MTNYLNDDDGDRYDDYTVASEIIIFINDDDSKMYILKVDIRSLITSLIPRLNKPNESEAQGL